MHLVPTVDLPDLDYSLCRIPGAAGLIVSINRILTKAMLKDKHTNTIIFFSLSLVMIFLCCIVFHLTRRTQFVRFFLTLCEDAAMADDQRGITPHMASNPEEVSLVREHSFLGVVLFFYFSLFIYPFLVEVLLSHTA